MKRVDTFGEDVLCVLHKRRTLVYADRASVCLCVLGLCGSSADVKHISVFTCAVKLCFTQERLSVCGGLQYC